MRERLLTSQTISAAVNSSVGRLRHIHTFAIQIPITAVSSPVGATVKLQASNDETNWVDLSTTINAITETGSFLINVTDAGYQFIRAAFAIDTGTFDATVLMSGKDMRWVF